MRIKLKNTDILVENRSMIIERESYNIPFKAPDSGVPSRRCTAMSKTASELGMPDTYAASLPNDPEEICRFRNVVERKSAGLETLWKRSMLL